MKLEDIIKTAVYFSGEYTIVNNMIDYVNIGVIGHFGNIPCFEIYCRNIVLYSGHNNLPNLGYLIRAFVELFDLTEDDGLRLNYARDIPCRLVFKGKPPPWGGKAVAIGHL